jgi:chromosomal replication initiation ATPase DnaA
MTAPHAQVRPIIALVAQYYGFTLDDVLATDKSRSIDRARAVAFFVARQVTDASYPELGRIFSRDHTTARHACKRVLAWMAIDEALDHEVMWLIMKAEGTDSKEQTCSGIVYDGSGCTEVRA